MEDVNSTHEVLEHPPGPAKDVVERKESNCRWSTLLSKITVFRLRVHTLNEGRRADQKSNQTSLNSFTTYWERVRGIGHDVARSHAQARD